MKFFIPYASNEEEAEQILEGIKRFAVETTGWQPTQRRIYRIAYTHDGKPFVNQVGEPDQSTGEPVIAILATDQVFLVCTPTRGVKNGMPLLVGKREVHSEVDFE